VDRIHDAGDTITVQWTMTGTHESNLFGIESTGAVFAENGIDLFQIEDGRITEIWSEWDTLNMAQELDLVPDPLSIA